MHAAIYKQYGPPEVVEIHELPAPEPAEGELLLKVLVTTVTSGDWRLRSAEAPAGMGWIIRLMFGVFKPKQPILGMEVLGVVEKAAGNFANGDRVVAFNSAKMGCHAEYVCVPANGAVAKMPAGLSEAEAAALGFGGGTALDFLRKGELCAGERILIVGASGCVGSAAVQLAKHMGAHVTGVCSGANAELLRALGADRVIDYTQEDFTESGETWDLIMDTVGAAKYKRAKGVLSEKGRLLLVYGELPDMLRSMLPGGIRIIAGPASEAPALFHDVVALAADGAFRPVIDQEFAFAAIIDAHRCVDSGHKRGSVVVRVAATP